MARPMRVDGDTVITLPGTSAAWYQPNPRPVRQVMRANEPAAPTSDPTTRPRAVATCRGRQLGIGWTMNGRATAAMTAGCLTAAEAPITRAAGIHAQLAVVANHRPNTMRPIMKESL